ELRDLRLERVDAPDRARVMLQQPLIAAAEDSFGNADEKSERLANKVHGIGGAGVLSPRKNGDFNMPGRPAPRRDRPKDYLSLALASGNCGLAASRKRLGFCGVPRKRTSKCRWGPVERPVLPLSAMRRPRCNMSPSFTSTLDRCA